jgi:hypothetical protein
MMFAEPFPECIAVGEENDRVVGRRRHVCFTERSVPFGEM